MAPERRDGKRLSRPDRLPAPGGDLERQGLLAALLEAIPDALLVLSSQGAIQAANGGFARLWELPEERVLSSSLDDILKAASRSLVDPEVTLSRLFAAPSPGEDELGTELLLRDGRAFTGLRVPLGKLAGEPLGTLFIFRDITDRKRAARRHAAHETTRILAESSSLEEAAPRLGQALSESLGWGVSVVWKVDDGAGVLRCVDVFCRTGIAVPKFAQATRETLFSPGIGLPGRVWSTGRPGWISDVVKDPNFPRAHVAAEEGLHGALAFPITSSAGVVGIIEFFCREIRPPDADLLRMMESIGGQIGQFIERKRTEEALRTSQERFRELAENIKEVFWLTDSEKTQMIYISPGYEEIWGRSCEGLYRSPRSWLDAIHPDDRERILRAATTRQVDGSYHEEYRILRPDGSMRWIEDRAFPIRNSTGEVHRIAGIAEDITRRWEALEELRRSEERYRLLFETNPQPMWVYDLESLRFLAVNDAAVRQYGYSRDEFLGMTIREIRPAEDVSLLEMALAKPSDGLNHAGAWRHLKKGGGRIDVDITTHPLVYNERPAKLVLATDVTARRQAEAAVLRLASIVESSDDAILGLSQDGRITSWNRGAQRMFGYGPEDVIGRSIEVLAPPGHEDQTRRIQVLLRQGKESRYECRQQTKDGRLIDVAVTSSMTFDATGRMTGASSIIRDITESKSALQELSRSEERFRTLVETAQDMIGTISPEGWITSLNPAFERITEWDRHDWVGKNFAPLVHPDDLEFVKDRFARLLGGESPLPAEIRILRKSRTYVALEFVSKPQLHDGKVVSIVSIGRDITPRKELERQVIEASEREGRRIGQDLHDGLGQDLTAISLLLKTHEKTLPRGSPETIAQARQIGGLLKTAIQRVRTVARNAYPIGIDETDLATFLRQTAAFAEETYGVSCAVEWDPRIRIDNPSVASNLYLIVREAVTNAVRHGRPTHIWIRARRDGNATRIWVRDDGSGLPKDAERRGGIGLRIMKSRAQTIGASLRIGCHPGGGTEIVCEIPDGDSVTHRSETHDT